MKIIVNTVPERKEYFKYLKKNLPDAHFIIDTEKRGAMWGYLQSLKYLNNENGLVLQDDIVLCYDFYKKVTKEIAKKPFNFINFFSMRKDDLTIGSRWMSNFLMNQCVYYPNYHSENIIRWHKEYWVPANYEGNKPTSATDLFLRSYLKKNKIKCWLVIPNLVNHRQGKSSIDSRRSSKRLSFTYIGPRDEINLGKT